LNIHYHPGKANVVADTLSRENYRNNLMLQKKQPALYEKMETLKLEIVEKGQLNEVRVKYNLEDQIRQAQKGCLEIEEVKDLMARGKAADYRVNEQGTLWLKDRICVPRSKGIQDSILKEVDDSRYSIHPGCTKMYQDLKVRF
jgi:polyhydroxyalkanoate synthesis regulator phasin